MFTRSLLSCSVLISIAAPSAMAQTPPQSLGGPVVPSICLLSREAVFANAAVGKAASERLAEITRQAQSEVEGQRPAIEAEAKALEGAADNAQTRQKREQLAERWTALQTRATHLSREVDATRAKALERISTEAQPAIAQAYSAKNCGLLFDRNTAMGGNFANDLTADVVRLLDAKIQTITFERERLAQPQPTAVTPAQR